MRTPCVATVQVQPVRSGRRAEEDARAAEWQHEQEMLQQDPAFLQWLDQLDAGHRPETQLETT